MYMYTLVKKKSLHISMNIGCVQFINFKVNALFLTSILLSLSYQALP